MKRLIIIAALLASTMSAWAAAEHSDAYWQQKRVEANHYYWRHVHWVDKHYPTANQGNSLWYGSVNIACGLRSYKEQFSELPPGTPFPASASYKEKVPTAEQRRCISELGGYPQDED